MIYSTFVFYYFRIQQAKYKLYTREKTIALSTINNKEIVEDDINSIKIKEKNNSMNNKFIFRNILLINSLFAETKHSYIVLDANTKEILKEENSTTKQGIASLTKIWTALNCFGK
ncbi:hypothetical protein MASR2M54_20770 [Aliarcobacter cryaerophilus]